MEKTYTVRQAAELTGVKSHVLRYWEEELSLYIGRNGQGHRCYTGYDIQLFMNIKELKKRGLALHAIKELIPRIAQTVPGGPGSRIRLLEGEVSSAPQEPEEEEISASEKVAADEIPDEKKSPASAKGDESENSAFYNDKIVEFEEIVERLIAREIQLRNAEEERCRSLDQAIRRQQQARREIAAAGEKKVSRRFRSM